VLDACPLGTHRCLLDVGGGEGAFLIEAAARAPELRLMLFDLPAVAQRAKERLVEARLAYRVTVTAGDFFTDVLPRGADIVSLVRVVHDHDDTAVLALLRNVRHALPPNGVLLLAEPMSGEAGSELVGDAYFGFYLLAMGKGRARTYCELRRLLLDAGFDGGRRLCTRRPMLTSALIARPV
jgi:demethylspheroidene O-methyltransferase